MAAVAKKPAAALPKPKPAPGGDPVSIKLLLFYVIHVPEKSEVIENFKEEF